MSASVAETTAVELLPIGFLKLAERTSLQHLEYLAAQIGRAEAWIDPIWIDERYGVILDGNHRYYVARSLGLGKVPCIRMRYGSGGVRAVHWHSREPFDPRKVIDAGRTGRLLPHKTTRHIYAGRRPCCNVAMSRLRAA